MKTIAIALAACAMLAGGVAAAPAGMTGTRESSLVQQTHGHGGGGGGFGPDAGVIVGVPWDAIGGNPPPPDPNANRCREARHSCFDQWGTDGRRYGQCMQSFGC